MSGTAESTEAKTAPWRPDELCIVNGLAMVYGFVGGVLLVRLPGGRTATVSELRQLGHEVRLPARLRRGAES